MLTFDRNCPRCRSWEIYKSRFRSLEILLPLWLVRPVRCGECETRFYRPVFYRALRRYYQSGRPIRQHSAGITP